MLISPDIYFKTVFLSGWVLHNSLLHVLFKNGDFLNTNISHGHGSVATRLRCGVVFIHVFVTNFLLSLTVKEFWKSVNIWWSYGQELLGVSFFLTHSVLTSSLGIDSADCCRISVAVFIFSLILCVFFFVRLIKLAIGHFSEHTNTAYRIVSRQTNSRFVSSDHSIDATRSIDRRPPESSCTSPHLSIRHGTGSLGHRVNGSFESSFTSGSPGHHFDPVRDPSFSGFRKNAQNAKRTFEMPKWQKVIVRYLLLDWNHWMSVHAMNFYFYLWLLKILCPENIFSHISRHLEFIIEQGHRVNWVSGSLDSRVTGSLGHKIWPSSISAIDRRDRQTDRQTDTVLLH